MKTSLSRRHFLKTSLTGAAGLAFLPVLKGCSTGPNDMLRLGFIGLGRQTVFLVDGFNTIPGVKIVAGCDVYEIKRMRFERQVRAFQEAQGQTPDVTMFENYQDLLAREDIDAVVIATPDHWHAIQAIDACKAGKDIYLEKPLVFTIKEGIELTKAVRSNNRILAVGSQQRSDPNFQHVVQTVQNGRLGSLNKVHAWVGPPPTAYDLPEEQIPAGLDWDKWLGPNPYVHYNHRLAPPIQLDPEVNEDFWAEWRYFKETGGGFLTDWGAHNFDIAQWALGKQYSGPVEIRPAGYNGHEYISFVYGDGTIVWNEPFSEDRGFGLRFEGSDGWLEVARGRVTASEPELMPPGYSTENDDIPYETGTPHLVDFVEAVKNKKDPIANVEAGHRTGSVGILGNIATSLNRPLKWDPDQQRFVDDSEADQLLHRPYRDGYTLG
ncbi:Gfo/Idh/MocA family oxidoreductase [Balneolaceae bacterium ANBcel3]|nr:Gfo/Idh/MocA family oxidoreductase [Balneolaceae bacterium ANBcel3]